MSTAGYYAAGRTASRTASAHSAISATYRALSPAARRPPERSISARISAFTTDAGRGRAAGREDMGAG